ncbi:hypothetical protein [Pseudocitrobacter corydidari]|uniref:Uncharacterized protein n=1 Tax=Pseudocitrobacter corydidari TaxID=2891570 RepID=A0ABY3S900_9ENTR|nr:hypothetical protein [Pseudocitrobacter corydidari]UGS42589.1 hypothetical protein G163CM_33300 [Pseudocitrobacter corydidari]
MSGKDILLKNEIEMILQGGSIGGDLKLYFESLDDNNLRRALFILSRMYPVKLIVSDDEVDFISSMLSSERITKQNNFFEFVRSISIVDFNCEQKNVIGRVIKSHFTNLCERCSFELDELLMRIFSSVELMEYMKALVESSDDLAVLQHISDILRDEYFYNSNVTNEILQILTKKIPNLAAKENK